MDERGIYRSRIRYLLTGVPLRFDSNFNDVLQGCFLHQKAKNKDGCILSFLLCFYNFLPLPLENILGDYSPPSPMKARFIER